MPSKYKSNNPTWSPNIRQQPLPSKCAIGHEWKEPTHFSNNQLKIWHNTKRSPNDGVNGENIGIICREHSGAPALELKCNGPCGLRKQRDKFSMSQRRNKLRWCAGCIRWQAQQDWDSVPIAAPNEANEAADEREGFATFEEGIGFLADDQYFGHHATSGSTRSLDEEDDIATDNEDEGGPQESVTGSRHFGDDDDDEDNSSDDEFISASNIAPVASILKPMSAISVSTPNRSSSRPNQTRVQGSRVTPATSVGLHSAPSLASYAHHTSRPSPSDRGNSTQTRPINSMTDLWVAPHLLAQENQVTLRERNLTERHLPGSRPTPPTRPPHMRTRQSRNDSAASQSRTIETRLSEASFSTDAVDDNVSVPDYLTGSPPRTSNQIGTWTHSVVSSGSLAAVPTMSTNSQSNIGTRAVRTQVFNAFDPQGNAHRRMLERASTETSTAAAPSAHTITDRSKPVRGNFARPDQRRIFDTYTTNARTGTDHVDVDDSGSDDEM